MEVEYLIEKLGPYLGGIDVGRIKKMLEDRQPSAVSRILGVEAVEEVYELECVRLAAFLERYVEEEKRLRQLLVELRTMGVSPSDLVSLKRRIKAVRKNIRIYKEMYNRCHRRSMSSRVGPQGFNH
ncbi:MAG: hypothetical protein ABWK05_05775 [Pyrobaculum sp.]